MRFKKSNCRKKMVFSQPDVPALGEVANFGTDYFLLKIKFLAKREREFTTKFAIAPNVCWQMPFFFLLSFYILFCRLNNSDIL